MDTLTLKKKKHGTQRAIVIFSPEQWVTFKVNGKREFTPRDQVFSLLVVYCSLLLKIYISIFTSFLSISLKSCFQLFFYVWAQLFEGRLALNPGLNLTQVSFSSVQKHFLG